MTHGGATFTCANGNTAECTYEQLAASPETPTVTSINVEGDTTLSCTGTNLPTTGFVGQATFGEVTSSEVTNQTAKTNVKAVWSLGVPAVAQAAAPVLRFEEEATGHVFFALVQTTALYSQAITSSSSKIECSFAGGCLYEIAGKGVSSKLAMKPKDNFVEVCGEPCLFDAKESTATSAKCRLPPMPTSYANTNFGISTQSEDLKSGIYFGTGANYANAFDNHLGTTNDDTAASCNIGMKYKPGFVAQISQVKFYL